MYRQLKSFISTIIRHTGEQCNKVICYSTNLFEKCVRRFGVYEWMFGVVGLVPPEYRNFICIRSNVGRWHGAWFHCWSFCCHGNVCCVRLLSNRIIEQADNNISRFIYKLEFGSIIITKVERTIVLIFHPIYTFKRRKTEWMNGPSQSHNCLFRSQSQSQSQSSNANRK